MFNKAGSTVRAPLCRIVEVLTVAVLTGCTPDGPTAARPGVDAPVSASVAGASGATFTTDVASFEAALAGQEVRRESFDLDNQFLLPEPVNGAMSLEFRELVIAASSVSWSSFNLNISGRLILANGTVRFTFPAPTTAASIRVGNVVIGGVQVRMALSNGEAFTFPSRVERTEGLVLAVHSAEPFTYIELTPSSALFPQATGALYDDVSWAGNAAPTVTGFTLSASPARLLPSGAEVTIAGVTSRDPGGDEDGPFTTSIDCGNGTQATPAGLCRYTTIGTYVVGVTVTDREGAASAPLRREVRVVYDVTGFFNPVRNLPTRNVVRAGSAVPFKFSLNGNQGLQIMREPLSQGIACGGGVWDLLTNRELNETPGNSGLQYDSTSDQYTFVWATRPEWAGTCRRFDLFLLDGTVLNAVFDFRR